VLATVITFVLALIGRPLLITSGYRSAELNAVVRGAPGSAHVH
jgi:uncharacterized protein YcbK (DUF882 family)